MSKPDVFYTITYKMDFHGEIVCHETYPDTDLEFVKGWVEDIKNDGAFDVKIIEQEKEA